jgi:polysaccharide export outer membrane protein
MILKAMGAAILGLLLLGATVPYAAAATPATRPSIAESVVDPSTPAGSATPALIVLGPGDSIGVHVYGQPDMDGNVYVADDGSISLPLIGSIKVGGLSPVAAAKRVEAAFKEHQVLVDPHVSIAVLQSHSQLVSVLGEVHTPGRYPISPGTNVIALIAQAGGITDNGANRVYVLRPDARGNIQRYVINLQGIGDTKDALPVTTLRAGDSVYVPRAQQFYIYGEVSMPGMYRLEPRMTVIEAIARAGGVTARGTTRGLEIKRAGPGGRTVIVHAKPDDLVEAGDDIRVKESVF